MKIKKVIDSIRHGVDLIKGEESTDKTFCSARQHPDESTARAAFSVAREKLFAVHQWSDISSITANFFLHDRAGHPKPTGRPEVGDCIRVELPGPTPENWVRLIQLVDEENRAAFTAQPCADPRAEGGQTEHFFTDDSTSEFRVEREGTTIKACQVGQHESVNNQEPEAGDRAVVNTLIAGAGWLFYQRIQWKTLTDYLVDK
ncbi:hypothetical protein GCM10027299_38300 [Larkinella ripae]